MIEYNTDTFIYICIIIGAMVLGRRIRPEGSTIVGLIFGIVVVYYIRTLQSGTLQTFFGDMDRIMGSGLLKTERNRDIYRDSVLLQFLDTYSEYRQYNPDAYNELVRHLNDIITVTDDFEATQILRQRAKDTYQSFSCTVPQTEQSMQKYRYGEYLLGGYLDTYVKEARDRYIKDIKHIGIGIHTQFPSRWPVPDPA